MFILVIILVNVVYSADNQTFIPGTGNNKTYFANLMGDLQLGLFFREFTFPPSTTKIILNSTYRTNLTSDNLTVYWTSTSNSEKNRTINITDWRMNGTSITVLNMPFENTSKSGLNATDFSTYSNNGTVINAKWNSSGKNGGAYYFNGKNAYIKIKDSPVFDLKKFSISAWIKMPTGLPDNTWRTIIAHGDDSWRLQNYYTAGTMNFAVTGLSTASINGVKQLNDSRWHHVVAIYNGVNLTLYADGKFDATTPSTGTPSNSNYDVYISENAQATGRYWNGSLDDIRIYNRTLSIEEIKLLNLSKDNVFHSNDKHVGEVWKACITPNDGIMYGTTNCSNALTILHPLQIENVILNTTHATNDTTENLTAYWDSIEPYGGRVINITDWRRYGKSIAVLNMPFENYSRTGWSASKNVTDYSSWGNNGTISGATYVSTGGFDDHGAYHFDGKNDYINITGGSSLKPKNITVSVWVNQTVLKSNFDTILIKGNTTNWATGYGLAFDDNQNGNGDLLTFWVNNYKSVSGGGIAQTSLTLNKWTHIVGTYDGANVKIYKDGAEEDSNAYTTAIRHAARSLIIGQGGTQASPNFLFNGTIDDLRIYNRSLSAAEVLALYHNRTDIIVAEETIVGENWSVCITPNNGARIGKTGCSNNLTIKDKVIIKNIFPNQSRLSQNITTEINVSITRNATYTRSISFNATATAVESLKITFNWFVNQVLKFTQALASGAVSTFNWVFSAVGKYNVTITVNGSDATSTDTFTFKLRAISPINVSDFVFMKNVCINNSQTRNWTSNFTAYIILDTTDRDRFRGDGKDILITENSSRHDVPLDRKIYYNNTVNTFVFFRTNRIIPKGTVDCNYNMYYNDSDRTVNLENASNVFLWYEDFESYGNNKDINNTRAWGPIITSGGVGYFKAWKPTDGAMFPAPGSTVFARMATSGGWATVTHNMTSEQTAPMPGTRDGNYSYGGYFGVLAGQPQLDALIRGKITTTWNGPGYVSQWHTTGYYFNSNGVSVREINDNPTIAPRQNYWYFQQYAMHEDDYWIITYNDTAREFNQSKINTAFDYLSAPWQIGDTAYGADYMDDVWIRDFYGGNPDQDVVFKIGDESHTYNFAPQVNNVFVNSTYATNYTTENLTVHWNSTDLNKVKIINITDWRINGKSIALLNLPFEAQLKSTTNTTDYSSYGFNATVINGANALFNATGGHDGGGAYQFNGKNGYIAIKHNPKFVLRMNFSISAWIKMPDLSGNMFHSLITKGDSSWRFQTDYTSRKIGLATTGLSNVNTPLTTNELDDDKWHFIVATYDGINKTMYVDGAQDTSLATTGKVSTNSQPIYIGENAEVLTRYWNGSIDDIKIYNRTLTRAQVLFLYKNRTDIIYYNETRVGENWSACVTPNDRTQNGTTRCSNNLTIRALNHIPTRPTPTKPNNGNDTLIGLNVTFNWTTSTDADGNDISYYINLTSLLCAGQQFGPITANNYTSPELKTAVECGYYNWTVRAYDGTGYNISNIFNFSIQTLLNITLTQNVSSFGNMSINEVNDTTDENPPSFVVESNSNVLVNVTVKALDDLWETSGVGNNTFQYKVNETTEPRSFNFTSSQRTFRAITGSATKAIRQLKYRKTNNTAKIELKVTVPPSEPPGKKTSNIMIEGVQA